MENESVNNIIITSQGAAAAVALSEVQKIDSGARLVKKLSFTEQLIYIPMEYIKFLEEFAKAGSIFIRHIFPVTSIINSFEQLTAVCELMEKAYPFAIQMRKSSSNNENSCLPKETTLMLENILIEKGFIHDHKCPKQIISIYEDSNSDSDIDISGGGAYIGISYACDNISHYNGGMHRFRKDDGLISRAEFKLLEAIEDFGIIFPENARAIDLGAAPGGFSRVLLERGLHVTAVDPAELDNRMYSYGKRLTHFKGLAEYFAEDDAVFDFMTNDMRMDMMDSVTITNNMSRYLKDGGMAIMTLKLSDGGWLKKTKKAIAVLEKKYDVVKVRQLFNNRSEVTVLLRRNMH